MYTYDIATSFNVQATVKAAMQCHAISEETMWAFYRLPGAISRTVMEAVTEMVFTNGLNPKNLTVVAKLFTASVEVAQRRTAA